jgi:hypothetical protein
MMAKRKRKRVLPSVTVLGLDRKLLVAFLDGIERLGYLCSQLEEAIDVLKVKGAAGPRKRPAKPVGNAAEGRDANENLL